MDSNQYAIELVTYLLVLVVYFYELIVYMLLGRNAFDSIAFFSHCRVKKIHLLRSVFSAFKTMEQPDHMMDMVVTLSLNFCPCKVWYRSKNLWDQRKGTKEGLLTLEFL